MDIPKFHETFSPILDILSNGETLHTREMQRLVIEKYYSTLSSELLNEKTKSGEILINNRIAWGKSYLKKGGYIIYPERGNVKITEKGLNHRSNLTLKSIEDDSSILQFYREENSKEKSDKEDIVKIQNSSPQDLIDEGFSQIETEVKNDLLEKLKTIDPYYFEKVILILLKKMGYGDFIETSKSSDGGIDGIINEDKLGLDKIYIQAKRFNENKVREKDIRNFIGAMSGDTNKGVFVTTSIFDKGAIEKAKNAHHKIILLDGLKLVDLMHEFNVGIQIKSVYEIKQLDEDFFVEQ
ncbi:restriction endonuclease [Flavobacterium sandaracinum]|uniref:Restriction endonuclease n=1 Tax=Flavobacterium sandaracinum TaxID=2541733 RepID=A0A4R5CUH9_9FLAO|nr:restriction endonuclease [Flavobacterium sandaracinum]TDE03297.1 restriction endonuclease [Flavobacterium sandaracinum]